MQTVASFFRLSLICLIGTTTTLLGQEARVVTRVPRPYARHGLSAEPVNKSKNRPTATARTLSSQLESMSAIKADFQVNDNNGSGYTQYYPAVATAKNGNRLVAWLDERDGVVRTYIFPSGNDVYGRVFSNQGIPLTQSFKINSGTHAPIYSLAASSSGDFFAVAWATSDNTVQLRVFTADGVPITDPQESDLLGSEVSLAMSKDRILIVSNGAPIWGQFFDLSGNKSGTKVPLLDFGLNLGWRSPRVSMRGDGSFV